MTTRIDPAILDRIFKLVQAETHGCFTPEEIAKEEGLDAALVAAHLEWLSALEREFENPPAWKGIAKIFIQGRTYYEALSDNPDVRRDYDYRATNEGGRDLCPKNMFYYMWAWINMLERKCREGGIANNHTVLITHDCRQYPVAIVETACEAARLRGYRVVFARADGTQPSCVSSYSHAVRMARPSLAVFITASHVSRPAANTIVGAKVSIIGTTGRLESLSTRDIKIATAHEIHLLKNSDELHREIRPAGASETISASDSHTRLAVAGVLASFERFPGVTLYDLAKRLKDAADIDALLSEFVPAQIPALFTGLRIVVDGAHTSSGPLAEKAFAALGAGVTLLHGDVREIHGLHEADPSITRNLAALFEAMTARQAHMGVAFDLDGDRGAIVLRDRNGEFSVLAPDKLGQVLMPFLMKDGGYSKTPRPMYVRDCLSTDALLDQGTLSGIAVETTDAGYVFLKKRENDRAKEGCLAISMGEASGHVWLDYTGPFENPILVALLFASLCIKHRAVHGAAAGGIPPDALEQVFSALTIPYRKSTRFQPLFAPALIAEVAQTPANDTGWTSGSDVPVPQKVISLCRSASIEKLKAYFTDGRTFATPLGELRVGRFEADWDADEKIFRFGKIHFQLNGVPAGSFVSRGSSNDPTAVQVWEVKEFGGATWAGTKLPEADIQQRFDLIGGLVLCACEKLKVLELVDRKPAANMAGVLPSVERFRAMTAGAPLPD